MQGREKGKLFGILIISSKCVFTMTLWPEMKVLTPLWPESSGLMTSCTWRKKVYLIFCTWSLKRILHNISFTFNENQYFIIRNCNIIFLIFRGQSDLKNKLRTQKKIPIWWAEIAGNLIEEKKMHFTFCIPTSNIYIYTLYITFCIPTYITFLSLKFILAIAGLSSVDLEKKSLNISMKVDLERKIQLVFRHERYIGVIALI